MTFFSKKIPLIINTITVLIILCSTHFFYAQEASVQITDSLVNKSSQELVQLIKSAKLDKAAFYEKVVLKRAKENNTAEIYQELGRRFSKEENYEKAHQYLDEALDLAKKNNEKRRTCVISIIKAKSFMLDGNNEQAVDLYNTAIDIAKKHAYVTLENIATSSYISLISQMDDQLEKALDMSDKLLLALEQSSDRNTKNYVQMLTTINDVYLGAEKYDKVISLADKGIKIADSLNYKKGLADLYIKKGIVYYNKDSREESQFFLDKAKKIISEYALDNDFHQKVRVHYFLAKLKYDKGLYHDAIDYLNIIVSNLEDEDTNKLPIIQTYYLLMECHRELGEDKQAWVYHKIYMELTNAYKKNEGKTRNRVFEKEENAANERIALEKANKRYAQIGLLITFVLLLIVGYSFWRKQKKNKMLFNNLISQIDQLESHKQQKEEQKTKKIVAEIAIDDDKVDAVLKGLSKLEKQEYFLKPDCSLRTIAKKTKTNATYLSKIINTHKGKNFNGYINDLRIEYALTKLKNDKRFRSFSIASIALEVGYKSDKSFVKHFKSKTGINPSYYIKNIEILKNTAA
ncbi:helix-turn-helix domain-containing protein [uncultured Dokdonia sp.]|uniref:helix-turn-helix domain-containing protein n=1 Tax=uncultured Dokdonia sp. TaxID=575653 RepID=UPI0026326FDC|nr:helix-turn-helix domain-containing protein [uncultured Dokdonia sp.]